MRKILLNPGPVTTSETVKQALVVEDICHREKAFVSVLKSVRQKLLKLIDHSDLYAAVPFASSGTGSVESMITSLLPKDATLAVLNNGAYGLRILNIARTYGIKTIEFSSPPDTAPDIQKLRSMLEQHPQVRYLAAVHHETSTGFINPIEALGGICKEKGITFLVDAISSFGGVPFLPYAWGVDAFTGSPNKAIQGMPGCSFVICKKDLLLKSAGNARTFYFDLFAQFESLEKTGEMRFTPPVQVLYAFNQALDELLMEGLENRILRFAQNISVMREGLEALGFKFFLKHPEKAALLLAIYFLGPDFDFDKVHDRLFQEGYTIYPGKAPTSQTFRVSVIGDLNQTDITSFLAALKNIIEG